MSKERIDDSLVLEKPYEPRPFTLIEVGGTIYHGRFEDIDIAGDVLRAWGMDYPRPGIASSLGYFEFHNLLSLNDEGIVEQVVLQTIKRAQIMADVQDQGYQSYVEELEETRLKLLTGTEDPDQKALINQAFEVTMPSRREWKEGDKILRLIAPDQRRIRILEGGIFDAIVMLEMSKRRGIIRERRVVELNEQLIEASTKEDIILVVLLHPMAIYHQDVFVKNPKLTEVLGMGFCSARKQHDASLEFNEAALAVSIEWGERLPPLRLIDLRKETTRMQDGKELSEFYARSLLKVLCREVIPEFSTFIDNRELSAS